ncbi:RNA polymerase II CTD NL1 interacting like phosphatase [Cryptosporidium sp. chipmunk genotype I]|uniref:RNA polymerase II CTD NL1 interacting like phosphatase n=1 Tax=Cryptosporidium sp. chipmunk genotype I TaxID=1280935 RepID=UPI00351A07B7|nr:RNA polymerase II CTD NL1 interacting like phosphatase [Cryptosporidium sp. chipmunk genotype I]
MSILPHYSIFVIKNLDVRPLYMCLYHNIPAKLNRNCCTILLKSRNFHNVNKSGGKLNEYKNISKNLFGIGTAICFGCFIMKKKPINVSEICNKFESFNDWSYNLLLDQINRLIPPDDEPLLPDFEQLGYPTNLPTLVLGFRGLICEITHSRKSGWGIVKRPGVDKFFDVLKNYYEIVIWSDESFPIPHEIIEKWNLPIIGILDKNHFSRTNGKLFKNLSRLGRNLNRVVLVDNESYSANIQYDNSIVLPVFKGDPYDNELNSITGLLKAAALQPGDIREYLKRFRCNGTNIGDQFNEYRKTVSEKSELRRKFSKFFLK